MRGLAKPYGFDSPEDRSSVNPLLGASEGEYRKRIMQNEYKSYMLQNQSRRDLNDDSSKSPIPLDGSLSKRQTIYIQKKRESESKSPTQEPNIYATKQRYKYSTYISN
jgi:hypothetical protein